MQTLSRRSLLTGVAASCLAADDAEAFNPNKVARLLGANNGPSLDLNFLTGGMPSGVTFSRASAGTYFDSTGTLQSATTNAPRFDYNPSTLALRGLLIEDQRTNGIVNSTMQGAVVADGVEMITGSTFAGGSGSTCPGWSTSFNGGTGTINFASNICTLTGDGVNAASIYQAITLVASYLYTFIITTGAGQSVTVQAGTTAGGSNKLSPTTVTANTTAYINMAVNTGTTYIQINNASASPATLSLVSNQSGGLRPTGWNINGATSGVYPRIVGLGTESGISYVDVRLTGVATSTTFIDYCNIGAITDIASTNGMVQAFSFYFRLVGGSLSGFAIPARMGCYLYTAASAFITSVGVVSATPTSAALNTQRNSGVLTNAQATSAYLRPYVTCQITNAQAIDITLRIGALQVETGAFATSYISTKAAAATRAEDTCYFPLSGQWPASGGTMEADAIVPTTLITAGLAELSDATVNNRMWLFRDGSANAGIFSLRVGGSFIGSVTTANTVGADTTFKLAAAAINRAQSISLSGGSVVSGSLTPLFAPTRLQIGGSQSSQSNGWTRRVRLWGRPLPSTEIRAATT